MSRRFSKAAVMGRLNFLIAALENAHGFREEVGWSQVLGRGEEVNRAYGEYSALTDMRADIEDGCNMSGPKKEKCRCGRQAQPEHPCPYRKEIGDDTETLCTCCDECAAECAANV